MNTNKPVFRDIYGFGKNKSRYLIPLTFKVAYLPNEEQNDSVFVAKVSIDTLNMGLSQQSEQTCQVQVNRSFVIQSFTANSVQTLGLNSDAINNGSMDILKFIKEFRDEFAKLDLEDKMPEQIMGLKRKIVYDKFMNKLPITWKLYDIVKGKSSLIMHSDLNNKNCNLSMLFFIIENSSLNYVISV